jgi:Flp pilus assembly protein TadG
MPQRWRSMGRRDSGAVAVETAGVSLFLVILLFGIVESSFLFKDWLAVSAAARAGARMGASQPRSASFAQDSANQVANALASQNPANVQEVWVYRTTSSTGLPDSGSFASCAVCVKFSWNAASKSLTQFAGSWANTSQNACAGDPARDSLGVYVKYKHTSPLGFFFKNMILTESTVMWVEPWTSDAHCKPGA